jgi:hypothetical protein
MVRIIFAIAVASLFVAAIPGTLCDCAAALGGLLLIWEFCRKFLGGAAGAIGGVEFAASQRERAPSWRSRCLDRSHLCVERGVRLLLSMPMSGLLLRRTNQWMSAILDARPMAECGSVCIAAIR